MPDLGERSAVSATRENGMGARLAGRDLPAAQARRSPAWLAVDIAVRLVVLWALVVGFLAFVPRLGAAVAAPGDWLATDLDLFLRINLIETGPLRGLLFATLNEPSLAYFALIVVILGYCIWRRRASLPVAAVAVGVVMALNATATHEIHVAGGAGRERPFLHVPEARTPIQSCGGMHMVALRDQSGPAASCEQPDAAVQGRDWREIWVQFATFPSGHVRETTALAILLVWFWPASWPLGLLVAGAMAFSRVHLGVHYPSDALAGLLVGLWSGGVTLFGIDLLRRVFVALHRIPPVGRVWDWIFVTRVPGRPDLDPLAARLIRIGAFVVAAHAALLLLGFAIVSPRASHIHSVLGSTDAYASAYLTGRLDQGLSQLLTTYVGPSLFLYGALIATTLVAALVRERRLVVRALLTLSTALLLAFALSWVGGYFVERTPPAAELAEVTPRVPSTGRLDLPGPSSSFPNQHVLLTSSLAGTAGAIWLPLGVIAQVAALLAGLEAVHTGAGWLTDALAGLVMGNVAAALGRFTVAQFLPRRS
jgi:membrane-associated phospholipid phosphatase